MKKHFLGILAVVVAVGMSAFTANKQVTRFYNDGIWHETTEACPEGSLNNCVKNIDGVEQRIYITPSFSNPLKYD